MEATNDIRLDKWLWAVRLYKTRTAAAEACRAGHVKIGGQNVKPARSVKAGEIITARMGEMLRTVKVLGLIQNRVGAKLVSEYLEDLTPAAEYEKQREAAQQALFHRDKGLGRPTKKERRLLNPFLEP